MPVPTLLRECLVTLGPAVPVFMPVFMPVELVVAVVVPGPLLRENNPPRDRVS